MKVLGPIVNGDNMMIGANAVMIKDAPFGSVQGGAYEMSRSGTEGGRRLSVLFTSGDVSGEGFRGGWTRRLYK